MLKILKINRTTGALLSRVLRLKNVEARRQYLLKLPEFASAND